jgi:hypothetical protein
VRDQRRSLAQFPLQVVHHALERVETEGFGDRGTQVGIRVDVVEDAAPVRGLQVLDAAHVDLRGLDDAPGRRDGLRRHVRVRVELHGRRGHRFVRGHGADAFAVLGVAHRRGAQVEAAVGDHAHGIQQFAAQEFQADDAALRVVRQVFLQQEQVVGLPDVRVARKISSTCASESTTWMRAPLPPWSGLSTAGQVMRSAKRCRADTSLKVMERGVAMSSVRSSVACTLLLNSSANTSAPFSTRAPSCSSVRMYARLKGTARVLPRR